MKANTITCHVAFLIAVITAASSQAATITWTNTAGGNWSVAANWNPNQVPGASDTALITTPGTYSITNSATASVSVLTLGGASGTQTLHLSSGTFTIASASTGNAQGILNLNGGTLSGAGSLTLAGSFDWTAGTINNTGGVLLNGTSTLSGGTVVLNGGLLANAGTLTWSSGTFGLENGTFTNQVGATFNITSDVSFNNYGGTSTFGNAGLVEKTGGTGTTAFSPATFINTGDVQVQSGTLNVNNGGTA
ncbi:MAG TPA: hypothetical protein VGO67_03260, partial [Verrucomicrobiae bacterium]